MTALTRRTAADLAGMLAAGWLEARFAHASPRASRVMDDEKMGRVELPLAAAVSPITS